VQEKTGDLGELWKNRLGKLCVYICWAVFQSHTGKCRCPWGRAAGAVSFSCFSYYFCTGIAKDKLIEALYEWESIGNKNNSLNNLIYRLRKWLVTAGFPEEAYVSVKNGACSWCGSMPLDLDVSEFKMEFEASRSAGREEERLRHLQRVCELYRGELLPQLASESWVIVESIDLKKQYEVSVRELGELLKSRGEYQQMYRIYTAAAELYPFEEWQNGQIESLMLMERYEEAYRLYRETVKRYSDELGLPPSQRMLENFKIMREKLMQPEENFVRIKESLMEEKSENGAYYCAYPSFVDSYRLLCRIAERGGQSVFLMSCTLSQYRGDKEKKNSQFVADWLKRVLCSSLRRGDLCTRYSKNQYLMLLVGMKQEDSDVILQRIERAFGDKAGTEGYKLDFSLASALSLS